MVDAESTWTRLLRWRRTRVAVLVAVAVVLLVAADRVAAGIAAGAAADRIACAAGLADRPSVDLGGVPVLVPLLTGRYPEVRVTAHDVSRGDLRADTVDADLRDVSVSGGRLHAARVHVDVTVGYGSLPTEYAGHPVRYHAAGTMLGVDTMVELAGQPVPVTILAVPGIDHDTATLTPREVEVLGLRTPMGRLPGGGPALDLNRPLPALPAGLRYESLTATDRGLRIGIAGDDLSAPLPTCGGAR
jgi:hypothetical protein